MFGNALSCYVEYLRATDDWSLFWPKHDQDIGEQDASPSLAFLRAWQLGRQEQLDGGVGRLLLVDVADLLSRCADTANNG